MVITNFITPINVSQKMVRNLFKLDEFIQVFVVYNSEKYRHSRIDVKFVEGKLEEAVKLIIDF